MATAQLRTCTTRFSWRWDGAIFICIVLSFAGKQYGVWRSGGLYFRDLADGVRLADFNFRLRERFLYEYDLGDLWQHEVRLEKKLPLESDKTYPVCIGGGWSVPPEDCGGPWTYMALRQRYSVIHILEQLADMLEDDGLDDRWEELREFQYWLKAARFNRREANRRLKLYAKADEEWQWVIGEPL